MNELTKDSISTHPFDTNCCRGRDMGIDDLVECLVKGPVCAHAISFGRGFFCEHPRRKEIAAKTTPLMSHET